MKKNILLEVDNHEQGEDGFIIRTLSEPKFKDKVLLTIGQSKMVVSVDELQKALDEIKDFQSEMEHSLDFEDISKSNNFDFEYVNKEDI